MEELFLRSVLARSMPIHASYDSDSSSGPSSPIIASVLMVYHTESHAELAQEAEVAVMRQFETEEIKLVWIMKDWRVEKYFALESTPREIAGPSFRTQKYSNSCLELKLIMGETDGEETMEPKIVLVSTDSANGCVVVSGTIEIDDMVRSNNIVGGKLSEGQELTGPKFNESNLKRTRHLRIVATFAVTTKKLGFKHHSLKSHKEERSSGPLAESAKTLAEDLKGLVKGGLHHDLTIRVDGNEFKGHKALLAARSPVFRAMFEHEMAEKQSSVVDINDTTQDAWRRFQEFLYTGQVDLGGGMEMVDFARLLKLADKYQINSLSKETATKLVPRLSVDNAVDMFKLAEQFRLKTLKIAVISWFRMQLRTNRGATKEKLKKEIMTNSNLTTLLLGSD